VLSGISLEPSMNQLLYSLGYLIKVYRQLNYYDAEYLLKCRDALEKHLNKTNILINKSK